VAGQHRVGPLQRIRVALDDNAFDVLATTGAAIPAVGEMCSLDLSRARIYSIDQNTFEGRTADREKEKNRPCSA
jgi:hypothetical protein